MRISSSLLHLILVLVFFFFNDTATTEIYTLSLHDALPIFASGTALGREGERVGRAAPESALGRAFASGRPITGMLVTELAWEDRKSTRLNSSHANISYAVFCLKKKTDITYNMLVYYYIVSI